MLSDRCSAIEYPDRVTVQVGNDVFRCLTIHMGDIVFGDIAHMRREQHVIECAERIVCRQRLGLVDVYARARDAFVAQSIEQGVLDGGTGGPAPEKITGGI